MLRYCLLILPLLISACGDHTSQPKIAARVDTAQESTAAPVGDFYKRYAGTIAGRPVVMHLQRVNGRAQGTYQYVSVGQVILLRDWTDTVTDDEFVLTEVVPGTRGDGARLSLTIRGLRATGYWQGPDSSRQQDVSLREEYTDGSTSLAIFHLEDSAALIPDRPSSPKATASYTYLLPAHGNRGFLYEALREQVLRGEGSEAGVAEAIRADMDGYFREYRKENAFFISSDPDAALFAFGYTRDVVMNVLWNDRYWLVTELFQSSYTGGAHGNYGSSYANIDLQLQHVWRLTDIVTDTGALRPMLNDAAIRYFSTRSGESMAGQLLVSEVPPTTNVYLTATGLTFVYNPYEIASYADGQISLFLPYRKLMPFLTPAFKGRMNLTERAGVAMLSVPI